MDYAYTTTRGAVQIVPASIHKMVQRGMRFGHALGEVNKTCKFVVATEKVKVAVKVDATIAAAKKNAVTKPAKVAVTAKTKIKAAKTAKVAGKKSNADLMRGRVAQLKATGGTLEDAIAYGINTLSQPKHQAKKYATDIWNQAK